MANAGAPTSVPEDFGAENGTPISNKATILRDIDRALGVSKPPAVEYLFVEPFANMSLMGRFGLSANYYGHAAVRYTLPSGEEKVMNITGLPNGEMVNFMSPEDYLFGTDGFRRGSEQGGIYNRKMVGVRIENVPPEQVEDLDHYYRRLKRREMQKKAKFSLIFSPFYNFISDFLPVDLAERGNCARWTSMGLVEAGLLSKPFVWPKKIFVHLFEEHGIADQKNVHVVSYRRPPHSKLAYGAKPQIGSGVEPLHSIENFLYYNLERYADIIVDVPEGTIEAQVINQESHLTPSWYRHNRHYFFAGLGAIALLGLRLFGGRAIKSAQKPFKHNRDKHPL